MKEYFYHREYKYIYLSTFFYSFANALIELFGVIMLYKGGMQIYKILFIYGLRFGIMGAFTPLFLKVSSKVGMATCYLLANILRIIGSYMLLFNDTNNLLVFIFVISISGSLSNPIADAMSNKYVESRHRGKFNSVITISKILGQTFASIVLTIGIVTLNNILLLIVVAVFFLICYFFVLKIDYKPKVQDKSIFKKTLQFILKENSDFKTIYSLKTNHIIERYFIPLYLYIVLQDFVSFSTVITVSLALQLISVLVIGKLTDKNFKKTSTFVTILKSIITSIYLFLKNPLIISLNKMVSDNFDKAYEASIQSSIQNLMNKSNENKEVLAAVGQMSLCFTEVIVFLVLRFVSKYIKEYVFYIIFVLSIISTISINKIIVKND